MPGTDFTKLKPRQRKYIEAVVGGMTREEAKRFAGYSETTRPARIENPSIKAAFARLIKQAVPAHILAKRIAEGLNAEETKFFQHEGKITDQANVIAWSERRQYAQLAAQYGGYVETETSPGKGDVSVELVVKIIGNNTPTEAS